MICTASSNGHVSHTPGANPHQDDQLKQRSGHETVGMRTSLDLTLIYM